MENEEKMKQVVITSKFNCQAFPLGTYETKTRINEEGTEETYEEYVPLPHLIEISEEDLEQIGITKCFDLENNCVIDYDNTIDKIIERKNELRARRVPLLKAFDVYKSSVVYGVEFESEEQREEILKWYKSLLELEENSFVTIPDVIKYYL